MEPEKIISKDKVRYWLYGKLHRKDGPAVTCNDGDEFWYLHGKKHRESGPAITWGNGNEEWYLNGLHHREDGPAIVYKEGSKEWWVNGLRHREDGPARIWRNGSEWWYINGKYLTQESTETAKKILSGEYPLEGLPLLVNHPVFKYFAIKKLGQNETT